MLETIQKTVDQGGNGQAKGKVHCLGGCDVGVWGRKYRHKGCAGVPLGMSGIEIRCVKDKIAGQAGSTSAWVVGLGDGKFLKI